ncbi:hypothetical protein Tco_1322907, partial [Tanacetum coccineum]
MDFNLNNENVQWELSLDIDDSDLRLTAVLRPSSGTRVETSPSIQNLVRIIPDPAEYMKKVVDDVGEDEDFKSVSWVCATNYVNANGGTVSGCLGDIKNFLNNGKLDQVVAIVKSCSSNMIGDLTMTMKDLSGLSENMVGSEREDSSNASPQKKEEEEEAAVKKKYGVANPISFAGPTEADVHRNALLEKLLMESGVYESAEEIAKREEILRRLDQ